LAAGKCGWRIVYFAKVKSYDQNVTMVHRVGNLPPYQFARDRLLTRPPLPALPERNVPCLFRRIALLTDFPTAFPYLGIVASTADQQITLCIAKMLSGWNAL
jgi:hypothetical protein